MTKVYICIDKTVPGLLDVTRFLSLDVTVCYVAGLDADWKKLSGLLFFVFVSPQNTHTAMFGFLILQEEKMTEFAVKGKTLTNDASLPKLSA